MEDFIVVTAENLEAVMQAAGSDQAKEFVPGCETWVIRDADGETGRMSRWPDGERGAIHWGADSRWGDWDGHGNLVIDDDGEVIDKTGTIVRASRLQMIAKMVRVRDFLLMGRPRDCQDFRVWPGIMGNKESHYVTTQRTCHTE